jgi:hypothetical protein
MQNDVRPVPGPASQKAIPQAGQAMVVPAVNELPNESTEDARQGGRIFTQGFETDETRPQDLHGAVAYQQATADPGKKPAFVAYTDLTQPRGDVRG